MMAPTGQQAQVRNRDGSDDPENEAQLPGGLDDRVRPQVTIGGQALGVQHGQGVVAQVSEQLAEQHHADGRMLPLRKPHCAELGHGTNIGRNSQLIVP